MMNKLAAINKTTDFANNYEDEYALPELALPELTLSPVNSFVSLHDLPEKSASFDCLADLPNLGFEY